MFFSIAWRNAKRSRSENLIYFLTMVTAIATFYIVLSLGEQDVMRFLSELESDAVDRLLTKLLPTVYLCALLFVFSLVIFANKYQLECRSRELGLYLLFGMTKPRLFIQIMAEGLISSLLALLGGLICGGFLSEISSLATARLVGYGIIAHQSSFSIRAVILTTLGFLIIQSVALFVLCGKLFNKEIQQMLYGEMEKKQRTGSKSGNWLSLILGAVFLIFAYWIILKHFMTAGNALIIVSVVFGIVGTVLSIRGLARLLSAAAASIKRKATSGLYIFTLRQLYENVVHKYISVSVASILIMLTIMLITDGSVSIMSYGKQITRGSSVYDFTVMGDERLVDEYLSNEKMNSYVTALNRMETGTMKHPVSGEMKSLVDWSGLREQVVLNLPPDVQDPVVQGAVSYEFGSHQPAALILLGFIDTIGAAPHLLPVSSYARQSVEQILYFSRLGAVHKDYCFEQLSVLETCREAVEDNFSLLEEAGFSVVYTGDDRNAVSDKKGFMFILGQIISNSVKYAGKNPAPTIQFSVADHADSGEIILSISDNGTGIPVSDLPFVFDKGFTGDTGSYLSRSTGMGLYLVRQMANDLTLKVSIFSNANGGTTVTLMFPKVEQPLRR